MFHGRMIFDLPADIQMTIKLRAIKSNITTGAVVSEAINKIFNADLEEARAVLIAREDGEKAD